MHKVQMMSRVIGVSGVAVIALSISAGAMAYEAGDWVVRAGYASVNPDDSSSDLKLNGSAVPGTSVTVDDDAQLGITASYMFAPHWGIEVLAATPFEHDIALEGLGGLGVPDGTPLGSAKQLPPTISVQYYFADSNSQWQPYAGVGVNYTMFFDESVSGTAKNALGAHNLNLDDSIGFAAEIGLDWMVNKDWLVNASVWKANIETDASVDIAGGNRIYTEVTIDPVVYMVAVGYRF
jgi:outer membrane protein